jgi:hypothetical protein
MVIVGIDPHGGKHVAAAVDEHGRVLDRIQVGPGADELARLAGWVGAFTSPRLVAVEGARGYGLALTRVLLTTGERVVDVAPRSPPKVDATAAYAARTTTPTRSPSRGSPVRNPGCPSSQPSDPTRGPHPDERQPRTPVGAG